MSRHPTPLSPEDATQRITHFEIMLEEVPVGLLLLDWALHPLWFNHEAAIACAVWNHGERNAAAMRVRNEFALPAALAEACRTMQAEQSPHELPAHPQVVSDHTRGLHARIKVHAPGKPDQPMAFHIQLDYRRPRGDRHRQLSPGAVALLARLTEREREVAMRVREGLRTAEIATELRRSPLTIKTQLASVFAKLGVRGRTRVAALLNR